MSSPSLTAAGPVLVDRLVPRSVVTDAALVTAGAALTAGAAQLSVPLWPVPVTGQTFAVLLVGTVLGPWRGALAMGLYLAVGVAGLPVFAGGASGSLFASTSGGFVVGFVVAAALVGRLAQRAWDRRVLGTVLSFTAGTVVLYGIGLPWLAAVLSALGPEVWHGALGYDSLWGAVWGAGFLPFLLGDAAKAVAAALLLPLTWRTVTRADR